MDPTMQGISADLAALSHRAVVLGAQLLALKVRAAAFIGSDAVSTEKDSAPGPTAA